MNTLCIHNAYSDCIYPGRQPYGSTGGPASTPRRPAMTRSPPAPGRLVRRRKPVLQQIVVTAAGPSWHLLAGLEPCQPERVGNQRWYPV